MVYDLGIIGGGPAGYVSAEKAAKKGLSTIVFEKKQLGGVCLNEGCIPSKTLLYTAKLYKHAKEGKKYGIQVSDVQYDMPFIIKRKNKVVKKLVGGIGMKMKSNKVEVVKELAVIKGKNAQGYIQLDVGGEIYECKNVMIATGSEAFVPPVPGLEKADFMTNREVLDLQEVPGTLNVIGGGVIGMEFANFFATMGTKVNVFEMMPEILPGVDEEITKIFRKEMEELGVNIHLNSKVTKVDGNKLFFEKDGKEEVLEADKLLVSVGRKPNVAGIGVENIGVELYKGGIKVDEKCRTNVPNVFAAGDVTGFCLLAHSASREGEVIVNNLTGENDRMRYDAVPAVVYTDPEIAGAGMTEEVAKEKGVKYKVAKLPMTYAGRFMVENEGKFTGLCKVLIDENYNEVIGVHMIGNPSSEMIYGACMAIEMQMTLKELEQVIYPHPTVSEIMKETISSF